MFRKLTFGDKKGAEAEEGGAHPRGGGGGRNDGLAMDADFYQRDVL